jgi:threonine 3-dehydrogenase
VDVLLEMSGSPEAIRLGFALLRTGGRASLLGIPSRPFELDFARDIIFKGAMVQGINGRKMYETWFQMEALLASGKLNLEPVITHRLKLDEFTKAMEYLKTGEAIKVVFKLEE